MRTAEEPERKIEMFLSDLAVKGNVAVSSMICTNSLTDTFSVEKLSWKQVEQKNRLL